MLFLFLSATTLTLHALGTLSIFSTTPSPSCGVYPLFQGFEIPYIGEGRSLNCNLIRPDNPAAAFRSRSGAADADIVLSPFVRSLLGDGELSSLRRAAAATSRQSGCRLGNAVSIGNGAHYGRVYILLVGKYCSECALLSFCVKRDPWCADYQKVLVNCWERRDRGALERDSGATCWDGGQYLYPACAFGRAAAKCTAHLHECKPWNSKNRRYPIVCANLF
jgi:hypothetical protein